MEVVVKNNQSLLDVAIEQYGTLEAVFKLGVDNNISITSGIKAGTSIILHTHTYNKFMQNYCYVNNVAPATAQTLDTTDKQKIFNNIFNSVFE